MKELSLNKLENLEGGKFWGSECGSWGDVGGGCFVRTCKNQRFWITISTEQEVSC